MTSTPLESSDARAPRAPRAPRARRAAAARPARVRCPRCGYDLRGVRAGWLDACPLAGTCAECGLLFSWAEMLNPRLGLPRWFVEHDAGGRLSLRQIASTLVRSFWPWTFWTSIRMTHPHRWPRVAGYLVALSLVVYVFVAAGNGILAWRELSDNIWTIPVPPSNTSPLRALLHAAVLPFSDTSIGELGAWGANGSVSYPAPSPRSYLMTTWPPFFTWIAYGIAVQVCCGLAHVLLPASRRKAKVRWAHIARITAYGLALMFPATLADAIAFASLTDTGEYGDVSNAVALLGWLGVVLTTALVPLWLVWWSVAAGRYLRMTHPWGVGLSVCIIGALTPLAGVALIWYATW